MRGVLEDDEAIPRKIHVIANQSEASGEAIPWNTAVNYFMPKQYFVYLMTNQRNTVLYTGITSDLFKRVNFLPGQAFLEPEGRLAFACKGPIPGSPELARHSTGDRRSGGIAPSGSFFENFVLHRLAAPADSGPQRPHRCWGFFIIIIMSSRARP